MCSIPVSIFRRHFVTFLRPEKTRNAQSDRVQHTIQILIVNLRSCVHCLRMSFS